MNLCSPTFEVNSWLPEPSLLQYPEIQQDEFTDWLIIGSGFTGLSAAYHLAHQRPSDRIMLVDSGLPGRGSSSRSSGFVVSLGSFSGTERELSDLFQLGLAGLAILKDQSTKYGIDCDWNEKGRLIGARGSPGHRSLAKVRKVFDQIKAPYSNLDSREVHRATGMQGYVDCIRQHDSVLVNPAKLLGGLLYHLPKSVETFQNSRVSGLKRSSNWLVTCNGYCINAQHVFVVNNGMVGELGIGKHRIFPMRTFVSVFVPTTANPPLGNESGWGMTSVERVGSSLRRVGDQVFVRNSAVVGHRPPTDVQAELEFIRRCHSAAIQRRFGDLKFELKNTWSGVIGVSANGAQYFGTPAPGLYVSCGYNGHGIAQGTISGKLLVDLALNSESKLLSAIQRLRRPRWIPTGPLLDISVNACLKYLSWQFAEEI